jgi:NitT/TauT family transport system substrate-binding protein
MLKACKQLCAVLLVAVFAGGCGAQATTPPPDQVSVQLKWVHQAQFAGFYVAQEEGYYAEENLEVTLVPGGFGVDIFDGVRDGNIDFSVVGADGLIIRRSRGDDLVAIATTYRINPFVLVAYADSNIQTPADFPGRTMALANEFDRMSVAAMMEQFNLSLEAVDVVEYDANSPQAFVDGEIDVITSFVAGSLISLQPQLGEREINLIWPDDFGVHFYSDTIITSDDTVKERPDLVTRFLRATLRGHRTAIEQPGIAVDATMQYAEIQDRTLQQAMVLASVPLIHTGEDQIGWMRVGDWQRMHDTMLTYGMLETPTAVESAFTLQFLHDIYGD